MKLKSTESINRSDDDMWFSMHFAVLPKITTDKKFVWLRFYYQKNRIWGWGFLDEVSAKSLDELPL